MMNTYKYKAGIRDEQNGHIHIVEAAKNNMELCLEVEMDDEVRDIIKSPEDHSSALLDVTVIKPNGLDSFCAAKRNALNSNDVRKLIASMEIEQQGKKALLNKIFDKTNCLQNDLEQGDIQCIPEEPDSFHKKQRRHSQRIGDHEGVKQVYTTPRTYNNIKSIFQCKNKHQHEENRKPSNPCPCQNCCIVGILTDSQKNPFSEEATIDARDVLKHPRRKKSVSFRQERDPHEECQFYFKHLTARIRDLEERIAFQEDRAVPKDYFKRIVSKLVNHIAKLTHYSTEAHSEKCRDAYGFKNNNKYDSYNKKYNKYYVNPVLIDDNPNRVPAERDMEESDINLSQRNVVWKWGSEILKPGIDLKNKIVVLLEDTLNNLRKGWEKPKEDKTEADMQKFVEELSKNLYKTIDEKNKENLEYRHNHKHNEERRSKKNARPKFTLNKNEFEDNKVNIKYVNPKLANWNEESAVSFKVGSVESILETSSSKQYKQEFLKVLRNTKTSDKLTLWTTIWNQAQANGQKAEDKVTIQIPFNKDAKNRKMVEIQYTLQEIQHLLEGK